jgi:hypothetical protein
MKAPGFVLITIAAAAFASAPAGAAVTSSFSLPVARAPHPLPLDPSLSDPAWAAGLVPNGPGPWENVTTRGPATQATTVYMLYDDTALYIGFKAEQAGIPIVATQTTNDVGFGQDDFVGIGVDTSGSGSQAYFFETTPKAVRYESANENVRYRPRWASAAKVTGGTWTAMLIVPLSVLRVPHAGAQNWRLQFVRGISARGEHLVWAWDPLMQDQVGANWPSFQDGRFWAGATGITLASAGKAKNGARADVYGLLSAGVDRNLYEQANGEFLPEKTRNYGIDVSYPITSTISFVGTANPDFSNVEVDQQTIAPQEFRRQLTEYRPFFSQGAAFINALSGPRSPTGAYSTASNFIFYSPNIGPFDWGTKVEGSFGQQSLGALAFRGYDETTGNTFSDQAYGYEHATQGGTFLYWSDGVLAHHSIAGDDTTIEAGVEGRSYKSGWVWYFDHAFETGTWVPQGNADYTQAFIDNHRGGLEFNLGYMDVSPNYNPIDGFTANSDIRGPQFYTNYTGSAPGVKNYSILAEFDRFVDRSGAVHQADTQIFLNATFKNGFSLDGVGSAIGQLRSYSIPSGPGCSGPIVTTSSFTGFPCYLDGVTQPFNLTSIPIGYRDGTPRPVDVNYSWGPFGDDYVHLFTATTSRPLSQKLSLGLEYDGTYERSFTTGILDSQWLRRVTLSYNLTSESTFSIALRDINGLGGFATQVGNNLAIAFHDRFKSGNELYIDYGTPAASATINRLIVKYIFHAGADAGT